MCFFILSIKDDSGTVRGHVAHPGAKTFSVRKNAQNFVGQKNITGQKNIFFEFFRILEIFLSVQFFNKLIKEKTIEKKSKRISRSFPLRSF